MDEQPKQLIDVVNPPVPARPGQVAQSDFEYVCHGVCNLWMFVELLAGWHQVTVTERRIREGWAQQIKRLVDAPRDAEAERITLACDNLNTHQLCSLYKAFEPNEVMRIARRLMLAHTPKHGSWLNMAEPELSALTRQCLRWRIPTMGCITAQAGKWAQGRNALQVGIDWHLRTEDARIKLKYIYPSVLGDGLLACYSF